MLDEYRNIDMRPSGLDAIGRLTRGDIMWACTQSVTLSNTQPIITPSQLDPAFSRMRGYDDYYTDGLVLRNDELPMPNHRLSRDCPVVMFLGRRGTASNMKTLLSASLTPPAKSALSSIRHLMESDNGFMVFDTVLIDPRWKVDMVLPIALRKMQEAYPYKQMISVVFPGRTIRPSAFEPFIRFGFHAYGGTDFKRFVIWAKSQPCLIMFSVRIHDHHEDRKNHERR